MMVTDAVLEAIGAATTRCARGPGLSPAVAAYVLLAASSAGAAPLPVPCGGGNCGASGPMVWVTSGQATSRVTGTRLDVRQASDKATLNWSEFNIADGHTVNFQQPGRNSVAVNRIFQNSPSRIFGALTANGQVYLINQNGVVFGPGARVNVSSLIASSLKIDEQALENGILDPQLLIQNKAAFASDGRIFVLDEDGQVVTDDAGDPVPVRIEVMKGAQLKADPDGSGRIMLLGQQVRNAGRIEAPDGQVVLAAGEKVYLQASTDPDLRGLLVEVDAGGEAWNRVTGQISTPRGNTTLVGLAVNQEGTIAATTSVRSNGSVRLLARDTVQITVGTGGQSVAVDTTRAGSVRLAGSSRTEVLPDAGDDEKAIDDQRQPLSSVEIMGRQIDLESGSVIRATGGDVSLTALPNPSLARPAGGSEPLPLDPESRIRIAPGSLIDVSGATATTSVTRNAITVELRANEFRDAPVQRAGELRGESVTVDARVGTPLADVSGAISGIQRDINERLAAGGTVRIESQGDIVAAEGSRIDVSGGQVHYAGGVVQTSQLVTADGRVVDIGAADPNRIYQGVSASQYQKVHSRWGVVETFARPGIGLYEAGYVEGRDAGTVQFAAPRLVLNGTLRGEAVAGELQRAATDLPLGGRLVVGLADGQGLDLGDFRAPAVEFRNGILPFDFAAGAPFPDSRDRLYLATDYLTDGGFTRTDIYSNQTVALGADVDMKLAPGSQLLLQGSRVEIGTDIEAPASTVTLRSTDVNPALRLPDAPRPGVRLADGVSIATPGLWVNDTPALSGLTPTGPVLTAGGRVDLVVVAQGGELVLGEDVTLVADAGAQLRADGKLRAGAPGQVNLLASGPGVALETGTRLRLEAYGLERGGELTIAANQLRVVGGDQPFAALQRADPTSELPQPYELAAGIFRSGGFQDFKLLGTGGRLAGADAVTAEPLSVAAGAELAPRVALRLLDPGFDRVASGAALTDFSEVTFLPDSERPAANLSLALQPHALVSAVDSGALRLEAGSQIDLDAGGHLDLAAPTRLFLDGTVRAPAGRISARLATPSVRLDQGFDAEAGIFVGATARLDASGAVLLQPNELGLRVGEVRDGGRIELIAERGQVELATGSLLDVSGASTTLDLRANAGVSVGQATVPRTVASRGGTIALIAPESITLSGTLRGGAGDGDGQAQPQGGTLEIGISRLRGFSVGSDLAGTFPVAPRQLLLGSEGAVPDADTNGSVRFDPARAVAGGFANLSLQADDQVVFAQGQALSVPGALSIETPNLVVADVATEVQVSANYLAIGPRLRLGPAPQLATGGTAQLSLRANLVDFFGHSAAQGFDNVAVESQTDIRATGLPLANAGRLEGSFSAGGELSLRAAQVYPTTFSDFSFVAGADRPATLAILGNGQPGVAPLSAGGRLTLRADVIRHEGVVRAPLGQIEFAAADAITLAAGSLTSTAADNRTILFGRVLSGSDWVYEALPGVLSPVTVPTEKRVDLDADRIEIAPGAVVDVSGGGDLYGYEFVPGPGGSVDALSPLENPALFAVIPDIGAAFAPFDTQESLASALRPGDSVYLDAVPGLLDAGRYALLPARYALLPGAVLVEAVDGVQDIVAGQSVGLPDGTPVTSGYRLVAGTEFRDSRTSGFAIRPGSWARQLAEYQDSFGNTFFRDRALARDLAPPPLSRDAGALGLSVGSALQLDGALRANAAAGGRGAQLDLSATRLLVTAGNEPVTSDAVTVSALALNELGAQSILLGGTRAHSDGATQLLLSAERVEVADGASLIGPELLIGATDEVRVGALARIEARGDAPASNPNVAIAGGVGGALLRVSSGDQVEVARDAVAPASGDISLEGATLTATGSILLDAAGVARALDTTLSSEDVSLASRQIVLGAAQEDVAGALALDADTLAAFDGIGALRLIGRQRVQLRDGVSLRGVGALTLDTPVLAGGGGDALFAAQLLTLRNSSAGSNEAPQAGGGSLSLQARRLAFGDAESIITGFDQVELRAAAAVVADGDARVSLGGDVTVNTPLLTGSAAARLALSVPGGQAWLRALPPAGETVSAGLGAGFQASAQDIFVDTALVFPSGGVRLDAAGDIEVADGARFDLAGRTLGLGGATVHTPGGLLGLVAGDALTVAPGAGLDVSAAPGARTDAGVLSLFAAGQATLRGTLRGTAGGAGSGGSLHLFAGMLDDFAALNAGLNSGGFDAVRNIETGSGDLFVAADDVVRASEVTLAASGGSLTVAGRVGRDDGARGSVTLAARDDLMLAAGSVIRAVGDDTGVRGGRVTLISTAGEVTLAEGAQIDLQGSGAEVSGEVRVRASAFGDDLRIGALDGAITGARALILEPVLTFATTLVDSAFVEQVRTDLDAYMANAGATIRDRLGLSGASGVHVQPGVEVSSDGALSVAGTWDLASWRFDGEPGQLTLRAAGDLDISGGVSDGFRVTGSGFFATLTHLDGPSWSYQLTAGADLGSALPWATGGRGITPGATGSLTLAGASVLRTGSGSIGVAADRDVQLSAASSLIYTAGVPARAPERSGLGTLTVTKNWLKDGGDIRVMAGRDVIAAPSGQLMSGWNVRSGGARQPTHWATDLARFQQGVAALGGGDIRVSAGGDIVNLFATVATSGAERDSEPDVFDLWGGGDLRVLAGGDIRGGAYSTWSGHGAVRAGGSLIAGQAPDGSDVYAILSFGDGSFDLTAARDLVLQGVINPTTVAPANGGLDRVYFYNYDAADVLTATAIGGDLRIVNDRFGFSAIVGNVVASQTPTFGVFPASLVAAAPQGDLFIDGSMSLLPAPRGDLQLLAAGSLRTLNSDISILLSDNDPAALALPGNAAAANTVLSGVADFARSAIHVGDDQPVRLVAAGGNIEGGTFQLAKHMEVFAGGDVRDLALYAQNTNPGQISLVEAGRDIVLGQTSNAIDLGGPGRLQVLAGRNVDLGFSRGIVTSGGTRNSALPTAQGADVEVWAGLGTGPDYDGFIDKYLQPGGGYADELIAYVGLLTGAPGLGADAALDLFSGLSVAEQRPLLLDVLFSELRESGREAASVGFERGFAAIGGLFPQAGDFAGSISMFFSQIYTLAGGDVNLIVPGGLLNVGLAKPPENLPVTKQPSDLGIVAQRDGDVRIFTDGDVLVNQSRIFTLLGGDILIWSSKGDIDAGRGAKSAISAPEPQVIVDQNGQIKVEFSDAIAGSGIRGILTSEDVEPGDVDLIAPAGEINAGDAGIGSAGNLNLVAVTVVGADNISAGGLATGVPGDSGVGAGLAGVNSLTASATEAGADDAAGGLGEADDESLVDAALGWLEVFVEGFGEDDERRKRGE